MDDDPAQTTLGFQSGQKVVLTIEDIAFGGGGVGRVQQFVVFVPFVLAGEMVEAELTEVKKRYARGRLLQVLKASPQRVQPPCQYFGACGGCQYQHIDYPAQLALKQKQIGSLLERIGKVPPALVSPIVPCPQPYGYRNRVMIRSQWDKFKQGLNLGFLRSDSRLVVDVEECKIAEPALNRELARVRAHPPPKGGLKVVIRVAPEGWEVPADSFFQNNFHLLPELSRVVREAISSSGVTCLLDAYCGVGFFSLQVADVVRQFVGVELDRKAVEAARHNALRRNISNGRFMPGRTEDLLPRVLAELNPANTAILLDPPRTGCPPEMLQQLVGSKPRQVLYVSCHPATLARDLNVLTSQGVFEIRAVVPLDMFPQTQHVECVADIRLQGRSTPGAG